jgi:hypothetical protein
MRQFCRLKGGLGIVRGSQAHFVRGQNWGQLAEAQSRKTRLLHLLAKQISIPTRPTNLLLSPLSAARARSLMQLIPTTWKELRQRLGSVMIHAICTMIF